LWPAAWISPYHSPRVKGMSEPAAASAIRWGVVVPRTTWMSAGCRVIHAVAMAVGETPYLAANRSSSALSFG
jgi:hypothetical protein